MKSKLYIVLFVSILFFDIALAENNDFLSKTRMDMEELNRNLPQKLNNDVWFWSAAFQNKTVIYHFKYSKEIVDQTGLNKNSSQQRVFSKYFIESAIKSMSSKQIADYIDNGLKLKIVLSVFGSDDILMEQTVSTEEFKQAYKGYISSEGYAGHRPLSYYKEGFEADKSRMPYEKDGVIMFDVNMVGSDLYYDCYIDDLVALYASYEEVRQYCIDLYKNYGSVEMHEDLKTYKIKIHYRYYSKTSKKLLKDLVVDFSKEL